MKIRIVISLLFLTIWSGKVLAQDITNDGIALFCKLWGAMKYHTPKDADGIYDWNEEFCRYVSEPYDLCEWASKFEPRLRRKAPADFNELLEVVKSRTPRRQSYVNYEKGYGVCGFPKTDVTPFPETFEERLCSMARLWNLVEYFYPYRGYVPAWDSNLPEYVAMMREADTPDKYLEAINRMCSDLNDTHVFMNYGGKRYQYVRYGNFCIPVIADFIGDRLYVKDYLPLPEASGCGLMKGDEIIGIDSVPVGTLVDELVLGVSNKSSHERLAADFLMLGKDSTRTVSVIRDSERYDISVDISRYVYPPGPSLRAFLDKEPWKEVDNVGCFYIGTLTREILEEKLSEANKYDGLVFDLRSYPVDDIFDPIMDFLGVSDRYVVTISDHRNVGSFKKIEYDFRYRPGGYSKPVVVLVDRTTQSAAETLAMLLQSYPHCFTVGIQTAGVDGGCIDVWLHDDLSVMMPIQGICYIDGTAVQKNGVKVDCIISDEPEDYAEGVDRTFSIAIKYIKECKGR